MNAFKAVSSEVVSKSYSVTWANGEYVRALSHHAQTLYTHWIDVACASVPVVGVLCLSLTLWTVSSACVVCV